MRKIPATLAMTVLITGLACSRALASTITYVTPPGATTSGGPVNASATFTTGTDTLTILLQDLLSNPTNVAQLPSDLFFTLSGGLTVGSVSSSSATEIVINADGTSTLGSTVPVGWVLSSTGGVFHLDDLAGLGHAGPAHLIIGPPGAGGLYSNANNSIAGNGPHNPFLNQSATFVLNIPGMTSSTTVTGTTFSFGSEAGINVVGRPGDNVTVPEPASMALLGLGLLGGARRFRRRRQE